MDALGLALLNQKVAVATRASLSSAQVPTYNTATQMAARVERVDKTTTGPGGRQVQVSHEVSVASEIALTSRVWIPPDGDTLPPDATKAFLPVAVERLVDGSGATSHYVVSL